MKSQTSELIRFDHVSKKYGDKTIFNDLSFSVEENDRLCIMAPSGAGKTTVLNIICGLTDYDGDAYISESLRICPVFQENRLIMHLNVLDNIRLTAEKNFNSAFAEEIVTALLGKENFHTRIADLSGGMARRAAIARALYALHNGSSQILLLDEPFTGLDSAKKSSVIDYIDSTLTKCNAALLLITHNEDEANALGCTIADNLF